MTRDKFGLFPFRSPLLGESLLLSLPAGTEMFHFPALPPAALCIQAEATAHNGRRVSPFGHPRITAWLPAPRGLSQAPTSFIGSWCQGVHRVLLETWLQLQKLDARVHCAVLKIRAATAPVQRVRAARSRSYPRSVRSARFLRTQQRVITSAPLESMDARTGTRCPRRRCSLERR